MQLRRSEIKQCSYVRRSGPLLHFSLIHTTARVASHKMQSPPATYRAKIRCNRALIWSVTYPFWRQAQIFSDPPWWDENDLWMIYERKVWFLHSPSLWCLGRRSEGWWSTACPRTQERRAPPGSTLSLPSSTSPTCSGSSGRTPCPCASSWPRIPPRTLPSRSLSRSQSLLCTAVVTSLATSLVSLKKKENC